MMLKCRSSPTAQGTIGMPGGSDTSEVSQREGEALFAAQALSLATRLGEPLLWQGMRHYNSGHPDSDQRGSGGRKRPPRHVGVDSRMFARQPTDATLEQIDAPAWP